MSRPPNAGPTPSGRGDYGRVTTAIRFSPELHERLTIAAIDRDLSINWLVNRAVEQFLDRLIPAGEVQWTREP